MIALTRTQTEQPDCTSRLGRPGVSGWCRSTRKQPRRSARSKPLGHTSASMALVYAHISDREVLRDYQAVLGSGATLAGPYAETLRMGGLSSNEMDWIKTNFFKTELELGHCLRLPQEGPCECDLYLT